MLIGTHLFEGNPEAMRRQQLAVAGLQRLPGVEAVNVQFRTEPWAMFPGIETMPVLDQDSLSAAGPGDKRKAITREVFDILASVAASRGHEYFAYINSDIVVLPAAIATIERERKQTFAICRHDVSSIHDGADATLLITGLDMFVVSVAWWKRHRRRFRPYVIGNACWDNVYAAIMMCHSDGLILNREPLILHERHPAIWRDQTVTARYNGFLAALDARYFSLWCEYADQLAQVRARQASAAEERALRDQVFVWHPSASHAMRQSIRNVRARLHFRQIRNSLGG
jgi:hypothetical protein